jgi:hypothetical protein
MVVGGPKVQLNRTNEVNGIFFAVVAPSQAKQLIRGKGNGGRKSKGGNLNAYKYLLS